MTTIERDDHDVRGEMSAPHDGGLDRRRVLRGLALASLAGVGLVVTAACGDPDDDDDDDGHHKKSKKKSTKKSKSKSKR